MFKKTINRIVSKIAQLTSPKQKPIVIRYMDELIEVTDVNRMPGKDFLDLMIGRVNENKAHMQYVEERLLALETKLGRVYEEDLH